MSDDIRARILAEALPLIEVHGFSETAINKAAANLCVGKREAMDAFPKGGASLVEAFSHSADAEMIGRMEKSAATRLRERVTAAVRARIEALAPHKQAARRAMAFLAQPQHAALGATLMATSVDAMWRCAGDKASDFSYYTKRAMLGGVYGTTLLYWLSDSSEGNTATWDFLDHRIDDVMKLGKLGASAREAMAKFPDPLRILNELRNGPRR